MTRPAPDIEALAMVLSEDERDCLLSGNLAEHPAVFDLARKGLAWKVGDHFDFVRGLVVKGGWKLRGLGLRLRQHLLDQGRDDG